MSSVTNTGTLKKYLSKDKTLRASVLKMTELLEDVRIMQGTSPTSTVAVGRLLAGALLLASQLKDEQAMTVQVSGRGDIKKIFAHAQYDGLCRAYISERLAPMSVKNNQFSLAPLVGGGVLSVSLLVPGVKVPRQSQLEIVSGEIGEDLAHYLSQSSQIPCLLSLAVKIGHEGMVTAAGGVLVELMPGHTEELVASIERKQKTALPLSDLIEEKYDFAKLLENSIGPIEVKEIEERQVQWHCSCTKEKAGVSIQMLGGEDMRDMIQKNEWVNVDCEMCGRVYSFSPNEITILYKDSGSAQIH
ncbi:MAG: Hsp33 family molecular chaperone HslO [Bdellovibrionales bacterium]|nr:Hsp33 family molecular chaperone HslO [Bdellovibrionales bacterium]